ncbi:MAG: metallophosphoesterase [Spirosomataceae bacterium]
MKTSVYSRITVGINYLTFWLVLCLTAESVMAQSYISNYYRKGNLGLENGNAGSSPSFPSTSLSLWTLEAAGTSFRIKNTATGDYLNNETGKLLCTKIQPGWLSAQWTLKPVPNMNGIFFIINAWTKDYLHVERGPLELTKITSEGWNSAWWQVTPASGFHMIIASDTQYPWAKDMRVTREQSEVESKQYNNEFVKTMNELNDQLGNVKGVIINGDLTNFGHAKELDVFKQIYSGLKLPMHVSLGNHDYANNVDDTYENGAANNMVEYMVEQLKAKNYPNSDYKVENGYNGTVVTTISGSLAYSWNEGNVHFVQLQYYPLYEREWSNYVSLGAAKTKTVKITNSFQWLANDLAAARNAGKAIIVLFHDPYEHWSDQYVKGVRTEGNKPKARPDADAKSAELANLFKTYKVSAVFGGHIHENHGLFTPDYRGTGVPLFYSGSADQNHYLLAKFDDSKMTVEKITSANGVLKRENAGEYPLFTPKPSTACGCAAKTFRNTSDHSWVEFRLPQGTGGQSIAIAGGAYNKYVLPKCNRVWWDDLSFKCNAATCQWEKISGNWDADALCTGDKGNSPYVVVGEK